MRSCLLLFIFLTTPLTCLDSENNQPTYKFGIVTGSVDVANATTTLKGVAEIDACIEKCTEECILAFVSNSSDCSLFNYGSITAVSKNGTGESGTVAFKVYTNQPACDLNIQFLLNGRSYPLNANDTTKDLWRIDTAEDGWTIVYPAPEACLICGNFTYARPYADGCNPECSTTLVQVNAVPGPLTPVTHGAAFHPWSECLNYCHNTSYCFVVQYLENEKYGCLPWAVGKIFSLNRTEAQDLQGSRMAIKIPLNQTSCKYTTEQLLDGQYYPMDANNKTGDLMKIETTKDGWNFVYPEVAGPLICGNFTHARPYPDSCNPECSTTMVQVSAIPGPLTNPNFHVFENNTQKTWEDCMYACHDDLNCFVVYFNETVGCRWWTIYEIRFLNRTETKDSHMAIKIPLSQKSCKYTTEELLDDKYYLPYNKIMFAVKRSFFRIRTTPKYYKITGYIDENISNINLKSAKGCEEPFVGSFASGSPDSTLMCVGLFNTPNITQAAANELCHEMDGKLMTERISGYVLDSFGPCIGGSFAMMSLSVEPYSNYGLKLDWDLNEKMKRENGWKIWFGLEKDKPSGQFKWQAPEWAINTGQKAVMCPSESKESVNITMDGIRYTWGSGQPEFADGLDCAYMQYKFGSAFPAYGFKTARCDDTADMFACGTETQQKKGIPPFQQIADEYGENPPYVPPAWFQTILNT